MAGYVFLGIVAFLVAYISAKAHRKTGSLVLVLLGSGAVALGSGAVLTGLAVGLLGVSNIAATVYSIGFLLAGLLNLLAASSATVESSSTRTLKGGEIQILVYSSVLAFMALVATATFLGGMPSFLALGVRLTVLARWSIGLNMGLFAISSIIFLRIYFKSRAELIYWYSLSLALIALGAFSFLVMPAPDTPLTWTGRFATYIGGVYMLVAVKTTS